MSRVARALSWVKSLADSSRSQKAKAIEMIYDQLEAEGFGNLVKDFKNNKELELIGFSINVAYIGKDENSVAVHPWAGPKLLFKHRNFPLIMMIGPGIELDSSEFARMNPEKYWTDLLGITG